VVTGYDKGKQMRVGGDVLWLEVRLCGQILREKLIGRDWRYFADLYAVYREVVLLLPEVPQASTESSLLSAVTVACGLAAADRVVMAITRNQETIRKYRREIRVAHAKLPSRLVWGKLFPADAPPSPVAVEPRQRKPGFRYPSMFRAGCSIPWRSAIGGQQPRFVHTP
jgi:hypothetical protein